MRKCCLIPICCLLLSGCGRHLDLPAQEPADLVRVTTLAGLPTLQIREIREKERVAALVAFVNSLPANWSVPWYGPQIGWVYLEFYSNRRSIGTFCVGPGLFGRVSGKSYSEDASRGRIDELGKIMDVDLWTYLSTNELGHAPEPGAVPAMPVARITPTPRVTPTAVPPTAVPPTRHP